MADLATFINDLIADGQIDDLADNQLAQFGPQGELLGARILPERQVPENTYREMGLRYQTVIALDSDRYSPSQMREAGALVGEFLVELGDQNVKSQLTARDYDALLRFLGTSPNMQAAANTVLRFVDTRIVQALAQVVEKQRWQAIVDARIERRGDNAYAEDVEYPDPVGHRIATGGDWTDAAYDPIEDIFGMADMLSAKGYTTGMLIAGRKVMSTLAQNRNIAARSGNVTTVNDEEFVGRVGSSAVNQVLQMDGLPPITIYDQIYRDYDGTHRYIPDDVLIFVANTGRDDAYTDYAADDLPFESTMFGALGYTAVGRAAGQNSPGRVVRVESHLDNPPRITSEGWQTTLPVIVEPEAVAVIHSIGD